MQSTLGTQIARAVIFDRDFRPDAQIEKMKADLASSAGFVHIHACKELENHLLVPSALERALRARLAERRKRTGAAIAVDATVDMEALLRKLTDEMKSDTFGQFSAQGVRAMRDMDRDMDVATCTTRIHQEFEHRWSDLSHRLKIIPGKDLLAKLNTHLQETCSVSLTPTAILAALTVSEVSADMRALIDGLERFISIAPPGS